MILLPENLHHLTDLCAKESTRYAIEGVHIRTHGDNTYRVMATDCKVAALRHRHGRRPERLPDHPRPGGGPERRDRGPRARPCASGTPSRVPRRRARRIQADPDPDGGRRRQGLHRRSPPPT